MMNRDQTASSGEPIPGTRRNVAAGDATTPPKSIGQELLATLLERRRAWNEAGRQLDEARRAVLELHDSGAEVEPGPLGCRVITSERRTFSRENLGRILGVEEVARLGELMPATIVRRVQVGGSESDLAEIED